MFLLSSKNSNIITSLLVLTRKLHISAFTPIRETYFHLDGARLMVLNLRHLEVGTVYSKTAFCRFMGKFTWSRQIILVLIRLLLRMIMQNPSYISKDDVTGGNFLKLNDVTPF